MRKVGFMATLAMLLLTTAVVAEPDIPDVGAGHVAWFDITTTNLPRAKEFYGKLFGWTLVAVPGEDRAVEIHEGKTPIGTIRVADGKISPFDGMVYIQVNDIRGLVKKAKELGGTVPEGFPFDLPNGRGAIAVVTDPSEHPVGLYCRTPLKGK